MANNTIKFDIKAAVDTGGLDQFVSQLRELKSVAEPADRILGEAVREIKAWAEGSRQSERNTTAATTAIRALTGAMTAGSSEYVKATKAALGLEDSLRRVTSSAKSANAVLNDFGKSTQATNSARRQIDDLRSGLGDLIIQGQEYRALLADIIGRETLLGRRTARANVVAANDAFTGGILSGFGAEQNLQQMPNTTAALRQRLSELSQEFPNLIRNSERYNEVARQMNAIERELARTMEATQGTIGKRSAATQAKIDALEAYYRDQRMQPINAGIASGQFQVGQRRQTGFGDVPQAARTEAGTFIAPPFRSDRRMISMTEAYPRPIGPQTALDYFESIKSQYPKPLGPQTPLEFWSGRISSGRMQGPAAPTELFSSIGGIDTAGTTARLQTMGRSYEQVAQSIRETAQAAGGSTRALQAERQAWEQLQASVSPASREYRQAGREMQRLDRQLGASSRRERFLESAGAISAGAFFGGPEGLIGGIAGMAIGGPGAALGGAAIGAQVGIVRQAVGGTANYAAEIGKLRIALKGIITDAEQYNQALEAINKTSVTLNIPVQEATQGFTRLAAAVVGAGGNVSDTQIVFRGISEAIKATGGSSQDVQASLTALSQVFSKGKVSAEELQGQLGERLPGAVTLFAQATGRTLPQLAKDLEQGTVGLNDLMRFTEALSAKYATSANQVARSSEDAGARSKAALDRLRESVGSALLPIGAQLQDGAADWLNYAATAVQAINDVIKNSARLRSILPGGDANTGSFGGTAPFGLPVQGARGVAVGFSAIVGPQRLRRFEEFLRTGRLSPPGSSSEFSGPAAPGDTNELLRSRLTQLTSALDRAARGGPEFKRLQTQINEIQNKLAESYTDFADPKGKDGEAERKKKEREERKRQEEAARQQRLDLQLYNDQIRLDEQRAENAIRLEDRVFQYRQELLRREREQVLQLDQLRQETLIAGLSPEGRNAAGPIQELLQRLQGIGQNRQDLQDQLAAAQQELKSARDMAANRQRFGAMYMQDAGGDRRTAASSLPMGGIANMLPGTKGGPNINEGVGYGRGRLHAGRDLGLDVGDPIHARRSGVIEQSYASGFGRVGGAVVIRYDDGMQGVYGHTLPALGLRRGTPVMAGQRIATVAPDGSNTHLHYELRDQIGKLLEPLKFIQASLQVRPNSTSPATTTLPNGREIRTPGAASAELRAAGAAGDVDAAQARVNSLQELIKLDDKYKRQLSDQSVALAVAQSTQSLRDQEQALRNNYQEWQIRNRLELENVKPELIEFELSKARALNEQATAMDDIAKLARELGPLFEKIGGGDQFRTFISERTTEVEQRTSSIIAIQQRLAQSQSDPLLLWQRKMNDLNGSLREFNDTQKLAINLSDQFSSNLAGGFSSAISTIVTGNGTIAQSFSDLFNNIAKMFVDMISRVLADQLTRYFLSLIQPAGPSGLSLLASGISSGFGGAGFGDLGGSVAGNFAPGLPMLQFAAGGISSGPTSGYPATLHGTEAIVPLPNGRSIPVEISGSGATSVVVNVNMGTGEADVSSSERDGQLLGKALSEAVQAELIRQKRPGGLLYR